MHSFKSKLTAIVTTLAVASTIPAHAQSALGPFSDRERAAQVTLDLVVPFGNDSRRKSQNAPRLQLGAAYDRHNRTSYDELYPLRSQTRSTGAIGFTLSKQPVLMLNGRPFEPAGGAAKLNGIETAGVVLGGVLLIAGALFLRTQDALANEEN